MMLQVNSEFYTGWLDHWGDQHAVVDAQKVSRVLAEMLSMGANVNMYVSPNVLITSSRIWCTFVYNFLIENKCQDQTKIKDVLLLKMFAVYPVHIWFLQAELISIYAHIFPPNLRLQVSLVELTYDYAHLYCDGPLADQDVHIQRAN